MSKTSRKRMKPYTQQTIGVTAVTVQESYRYMDSTTTPWTPKSRNKCSTSLTNGTARYHALACPTVTVKGDHSNPNAFWFRKTDVSYMAGTWGEKQVLNSDPVYYSVMITSSSGLQGSSPTMLPTLDPTNVYNRALAKLNEELRGGVDLSVDLAQAAQVTRMVKSASSLSKYTRGFGRKTIANSWLEFTYGWKPLANSLYESLNQVYSRAGGSFSVEGKATEVVTTQNYIKASSVGQWSKSSKGRQSVRVKMGLVFTPQHGRMDQVARLTSLNPVSIAWELVPYSFCVDWLIDIGGFLRDMETYIVMSLSPSGTSKAYVTTTHLTSNSESWVRTGTSGNTTYSGALNGTAEQRHMSRSLLLHYPAPRLPKVRPDLGATRLLSAASLLAQFLPEGEKKAKPKKSITTVKWIQAKRKVEGPSKFSKR